MIHLTTGSAIHFDLSDHKPILYRVCLPPMFNYFGGFAQPPQLGSLNMSGLAPLKVLWVYVHVYVHLIVQRCGPCFV